MPNTERIRALNDSFRTTFIGGKVMLTSGVADMEDAERGELLARVQSFQAFDNGNDPHHEHDFGALEITGDKFFFKIDYYDKTLEAGSEDPADPAQTTRVLTIMRADEY